MKRINFIGGFEICSEESWDFHGGIWWTTNRVRKSWIWRENKDSGGPASISAITVTIFFSIFYIGSHFYILFLFISHPQDPAHCWNNWYLINKLSLSTWLIEYVNRRKLAWCLFNLSPNFPVTGQSMESGALDNKPEEHSKDNCVQGWHVCILCFIVNPILSPPGYPNWQTP